MLTEKQFKQYAQEGYNLIPLVREILADLETPLSTYLKLANSPWSYLLESVQGGEKWGRYSIIGLPCNERIEVSGNQFSEYKRNKVVSEYQSDDPLDEIRKYQRRFKIPLVESLPKFSGGLVGYFGYDTISLIEPRLGANPNPDPLKAPDIVLMLSTEVVVFDNLLGRLYIVVHVDPGLTDSYERGIERLDRLADLLPRGLPMCTHSKQQTPASEANFHSSFGRERYMQAVERCRQYIYEGDIFQVVLSQRLSIPYEAEPLDLYRALRTLNPSPYMYFFNLDDFYISGSSPEILVRLEDGDVTVRPIAGTRRRGADEEGDAKLAEELLSDPKELAEHLMLIDLGRNDVGRVAEIGSVKVDDQMTIEKYSHVMHIVSNVSGKLNSKYDAIDVLKAAFPAGTLSGAPKVRALEIIEELEPDKRGIYSGAIGYLGWHGNMDTAIAIRTALIKDEVLYIQVGAGVVADSIPEMEWEETMNKGRAIFKAVELVNAGLDHSEMIKIP